MTVPINFAYPVNREDESSEIDPKNNLFKFVEQSISGQAFPIALDYLILSFSQVKVSEIRKVYSYLLKILPNLSSLNFIKLQNHLPDLLQVSSHLIEEQKALAIALGDWFLLQISSSMSERLFSSYYEAMGYYAKAVQIGEKEGLNLHSFPSRLFINIIKYFLLENHYFKNQLALAKGKDQIVLFKELIDQIELLRLFCYEGQDYNLIIQPLYQQCVEVFSSIRADSRERYQDCISLVIQGLSTPLILKNLYTTERYRNELQRFRDRFKTLEEGDNIREFQSNITLEFLSFFQQILLKDTFAIAGPAPCSYDIRAMGSIGREEICPFSDLEFFILVEKETEEVKRYFMERLSPILELQIISLGETSFSCPVFTSIHMKNPSGFHIDSGGNPAHEADLVQTPYSMARLQVSDKIINDPSTIENTVLKSISLQTNDSSLFDDYQGFLNHSDNGVLLSEMKKRALNFFKKRLEDYLLRWKLPFTKSINLKKQYVELLFHLLGDMALFWGIDKINTLDIIDALGEKGVFNETSLILLKESVKFLYALRIKTHLQYGEQREDIELEGLSIRLSHAKMLILEKIYWLVLRPLYFRLEKICKEGKDPDVFFSNMDLVDTAFTEGLNIFLIHNPISSLKPFIFHFVNFLNHRNVSLDTHLVFYGELAKRVDSEILMQTYLDALPCGPIHDHLERIPNVAGFRGTTFRTDRELKSVLLAISSIEPPIREKFKVKISSIEWENDRYLKQGVVDQILDEKGDIKTESSSSLFLSFEGYQIYLKQEPDDPLIEFATHHLSSRIAGEVTPAVEIVRFDVELNKHHKSYLVLITQAIAGKTLKEKLSVRLDANKESWAQFTKLLLCSILIRPGRGYPSHYLINDRGFAFSITNNISFVEPITKGGFSTTVHFCSALFCLYENTPLSREALRDFCSLDADAILKGWIEEMIIKEKRYLALFSEDRKILIFEGTLAAINIQFYHLQDYIKIALDQKQQVIGLNLLKEVISLRENKTIQSSVGWELQQYYQKIFAIPTIEERFDLSFFNKQYKSKLKSMEVDSRLLINLSSAKEELISTLLNRNSEHVYTRQFRTGKLIFGNFQHIPEKSRQELVLQALLTFAQKQVQKVPSISIQFCDAFDSEKLKLLLHEDAEFIDLTGSPHFTDKDFQFIQSKCPRLKELHLSHCSHLKKLKGYFPQLLIFHIDNCPMLNKVELSAPALQTLIGHTNHQLREINLDASSLNEMNFDDCPALDMQKTENHMCLINNGLWLKYGSEKLKENEDFQLLAVQKNGLMLKYCSKKGQKNKTIVMTALQKNINALEYADEFLLSDEEFMLDAVQYSIEALKYISGTLKMRITFWLRAAKQDGRALLQMPKSMKDEEFFLELLKVNGHALLYLEEEFKKQKLLVITAVKHNGLCLEYSIEFNDDDEVVQAAIHENGLALQYASDRLRNNNHIVLMAVKQDATALIYAGEICQKEEEIRKAAMIQNSYILEMLK